MRAAIIADDLTGANDSAASFAAAGLKTCVAFSDFAAIPSDCGVAVADTESRDIGPERASAAVSEAVQGILKAKPEILFKKIDSTMRGSIGAELEAALKASGRKFVLMAPALPSSGRTTVNGCQLLNGRRLEDTELARVPKSPVTDSYIPAILAKTSGLKAAVVGVDDLESLQQKIEELLAQGADVVVCDGTARGHLKKAAEAGIASGALLCGCAGLAREVSELVCGKDAGQGAPRISEKASSVLVLSGSISAVTRAQTRLLVEERGASLVRIDAALCVRDPDEAARKASSELEALFHKRGHGVFAVAGAWSEDDVEASRAAASELGLPFEEAGERMARCMGLLASLQAPSFDSYVFTGGDTACHACAELGATVLQTLGEIQSGVPACRILSGRCRGKLLATKAGAFGTEAALAEAADFLMKQGNFEQ
jgi:uncharacterized protein YgbK (DUF1537 family)